MATTLAVAYLDVQILRQSINLFTQESQLINNWSLKAWTGFMIALAKPNVANLHGMTEKYSE